MQKFIQRLLGNAKIIIFVLVALILAFCRGPSLETNTSGSETNRPQIAVENLCLCTFSNGEWISVDELNYLENQYVCASVESDITPVYLTLIIQKENNRFSAEYTDAGEFANGFISFLISPGLSSGEYTARILYARQTLAEIKFNVSDK